jgi:hypothetical protein
MTTYPSTKTIETRLNLSAGQAKEVRRLMTHRIPSAALVEIDTIIGAYGVEYIPSVYDTMRSLSGLEYCNTGDTYGATVVFDHAKQKFIIGNWGSIVECDEKRFAE